MTETTMPLISRLIEKTKNNDLTWSKYNEDDNPLKNTKKDFFTSKSVKHDHMIFDSCYSCQFNNTSFFLMAYDSYNRSGTYVVLYAQTKDSEYSREYASTNSDNTEEISELKRLYNIVESYSDIVEDSIRKFINL